MTKHKYTEKALRKTRQIRARKMNHVLDTLYPQASIALTYSNHLELLIAVILSAQCTDKRVNMITEVLFKKYPTLDHYVQANPKIFENDIHSCGFFRNKTKNILGAAKTIKERFAGEVPNTMRDLLLLPGVARKTANVVLSNAFGKTEGIAVDTHVRRFSIRFNLSDYKDPIKIEKDLLLLFSKKDWNTITYRFIEYGRNICPARKHECLLHPLTRIYPHAAMVWPKAK